MDLELNRDYSRSWITSVSITAIEKIKALTGRYPIIYSRASWVNSYLKVNDLPKLDWWLAHYKARPETPYYVDELDPKFLAIPTGVDREQVKIHQTTEGGRGKDYGVKSYYIDYDRFLGTPEEMETWFGYGESEPEPEPEPEPDNLIRFDPENPLYRVQVTDWAKPYVNLRSRPVVIKETDIDDVYPGEIMNVIDMRELYGELWLRAVNSEKEGWLMSRYTQRLSGESEPGNIEGLIAVPYYSQNDPRWKNDYLGFSYTTIGDFGCLITGVAAYMTVFGINETPKTLNQLLISRYGYDGNRFYWQMPRELWGIEKPEDIYFAGGTGFEDRLDAILADGRPALAMVDYIPGGAFNQHWVLVLGKVNGVYYLLDTWDGTVQALNAKYHKIYRLVGYKK